MTRQDKLNDAWCKYMGKCSTEIMQALAFALRWCDEHPNWISVENELPPRNVFVITCDGQGNTNFLMLAGNSRWYDKAVGLHRNITHWMPLPTKPEEETKWTEHTLQRDKDGFLVGEVSDLDAHLPFEVHDNEDDIWVLIEDGSALVDWSGDIDTKPRYDRIRTIEQVVSNSGSTGKKGGEE